MPKLRKQQSSAKPPAVNPLVLDGKKLIPSVTRVFSASRDMYVYLQGYEQGAATVKPLVAFVSFYQGATKVYETQSIAVTPDSLSHLGAVPLSFSVGLQKLQVGCKSLRKSDRAARYREDWSQRECHSLTQLIGRRYDLRVKAVLHVG